MIPYSDAEIYPGAFLLDMARKRTPVPDTEPFFDALDTETRGIALALRDIVRHTAPGLTEALKMGVPHWIGNDYVCYIADYSKHVNLGFHHGAQIKDPTALLEGTGKGLRHVKLLKGSVLPQKHLVTLIKKAVEFDRRLS